MLVRIVCWGMHIHTKQALCRRISKWDVGSCTMLANIFPWKFYEFKPTCPSAYGVFEKKPIFIYMSNARVKCACNQKLLENNKPALPEKINFATMLLIHSTGVSPLIRVKIYTHTMKKSLTVISCRSQKTHGVQVAVHSHSIIKESSNQ